MSFVMRTSKPSGNKFYITKSKGGYSLCVIGSPTDKNANVLANCVGYSCGRFNEIIGKMKYPTLNCNAENFIERAKNLGLRISKTPTLGGIMVWQKGASLSGNDGAGHVAIVERINNSNSIYTSESGWGGPTFFNATRTNNNGRWGMASGYKFRGCIINPAVKPEPTPVVPTVGDYVTLDVMKVRSGPGTKYKQKKVKELTPDGKKNATSTRANAYACYKKGTVFTALKIEKNSNNEYWAKTPSGYICIRMGKEIYCKKK